MANWKLGKIQYGFTETATSGGTLTFTASSKQYQILTGSSNHTVVLPDATTTSNGSGISFTIINTSTGIITVQLDDTTVLTTIDASASKDIVLTNHSSSNGVWRVLNFKGSGGGGIAYNGTLDISSNYVIVSDDDGGVINVDTTSGAINITLPAPSAGFVVTIKDSFGNADSNAISILRDGSENIDGIASNISINVAFDAVSLISDGTDWFRVSKFTGILVAAGTALFGGGNDGSISNVIDYVTIASAGNATDFGDLTVARRNVSACSSSTRGIWNGGQVSSPTNTIDYVTIASAGNATDFGDLTVARHSLGSCSSSVRGLIGGGDTTSGASTDNNTIDYVTIATLGNATDFGDLTVARQRFNACSSPTRGVWGGGLTGGSTRRNEIDYVTIATLGNATDFGDLTVTKQLLSACSSNTRGLFCGGNDGSASNVIEYITITSTGNATDFGDLTVARQSPSATSSSVRGLIGGGSTGSLSDVIDYVTIATLGNATDFGDLTVARDSLGACSNVHGGL